MGDIQYSTVAAFAVPALLAGSIVGLVAVWAVLGRTHWFWRAAAVEATAVIWLLIPAYELVLMFFVQSIVVTGVLMAAAWWRGRTSGDELGEPREHGRRLQFGIRDLLLLTLLVAVAVSAANMLPATLLQERIDYFSLTPSLAIVHMQLPARWITYSAVGIFLGTITLLAVWVALGQTRRRWRLAVGILLVPVAPMALWLAMVTRLRAQSSSQRWLIAVGVVGLSLVLALPTAAIFLKLAVRTPIPPNPAPAANVYPELMALAKRAQTSFSTFDPDMPVPQLATAMSGEGRALIDELRPMLGRECLVTPTYTMADLLEGTNIRTLERLLIAHARLTKHEGNSAEAVEACVDCIRLGRMVQRGGLRIDLLIGLGVQAMGHAELRQAIPSLDERQCLKLGADLTPLRDFPEPFEDTSRRDRIWDQRAMTWSERLEWIVSEDLLGLTNSDDAVRQACDRRIAAIEILFCALALRRYELRHGNLPERLEELSPEFLPSVPVDLLNGGPLFYQRDGKDYLLYSTAMPPGDEFGPPEVPAAVAEGEQDASPEIDEDADSF